MQWNWEQIGAAALDFIIKYGGKLLLCLIIFIIGRIILKFLLKITNVAIKKTTVSEQAIKFVQAIIKVAFYIFIALAVLSIFGVPTTQFVAFFSAVGLALSLAIKETLANFAQGVIMMFSKPFQIGDYIEANGVEGTVKKIELVYTRLITPDNKNIMIPNGELTSAKIINYSAEPVRRLDLTFSIGYDDNIDEAKQLIKTIVSNHPLALKDPEPFFGVLEQGPSSIDITSRVWVKTENYWNLHFDLQEQIKKCFDEHNINIPYQQMDIHILDKKAN